MMNNGLLYLWLRWCPGALGLLLRQRLYPSYLGHCGKKVLFGRFVDFINPKKIHIGNRVVINNNVLLAAEDNPEIYNSITIADDVFIGSGTTLIAGPGTINIGSGTNISSQCEIVAHNPVIIGDNILIAAFGNIGVLTKNSQELKKCPITRIGNCSWLGVRMAIEAGVNIGEETIIGAHSLVNTDIEPYSIAFGRPASIWKSRKDY